eukprot:GILI01020884.1.p1 GENE.GILI01020884.1~~GILI01020884.1.p1  ORF type:complete len:178 (-),score=22.69 GILI01020884.1:89-622(-)
MASLRKIVMVGDAAVGKSAILARLTRNEFIAPYGETIGVEFGAPKFDVANETWTLQIWDTAGQEKYRSITTSYYRGSHAVLIVYDVTNMESFNNVSNHIVAAQQFCPNDFLMVLVGTKADLQSKERVDPIMAQSFSDAHNMPFYEVSAKTDNGEIQAMFREVLDKLVSTERSHSLAR